MGGCDAPKRLTHSATDGQTVIIASRRHERGAFRVPSGLLHDGQPGGDWP